LSHLTRKVRDGKYDLNQFKTDPWIPNQEDRRVIRMSCQWYQMQQKGEEDTDRIVSVSRWHFEMIMNVQQSCFRGAVLTIG